MRIPELKNGIYGATLKNENEYLSSKLIMYSLLTPHSNLLVGTKINSGNVCDLKII